MGLIFGIDGEKHCLYILSLLGEGLEIIAFLSQFSPIISLAGRNLTEDSLSEYIG
jgi:hypothetical protein